MSSLFFDNAKKICLLTNIFLLNVKYQLKVEFICATLIFKHKKIMHSLSTIKKQTHHFKIFNFKLNTSSEPPFRSKILNPSKYTAVTASDNTLSL